MKTFQTNIDKLVSKILNEEIDSKFEEKFNNKSENFEELIGNQSKIDVADPKGKITAADFKKLRNSKYYKKTVVQVFKYDFTSEQLKNIRYNYHGIGDLIRGCLSLFRLSKELNFNLVVDIRHHGISKYTQIKRNLYENLINLNEGRPFERKTYLRPLWIDD